MIVGLTYFSSMLRYGSASNGKLQVLLVMFFLSEIGNSVACFYFYYTFY